MKTIFVVDDNIGQRELLVNTLNKTDCDIVEFGNAEDMLDRLEQGLPSLILLDVKLPGMTGIEALKIIQDRFINVSVILITAFTDIKDAVEAIKIGALDYLDKPIDLEELLEKVGTICNLNFTESKQPNIVLPDYAIAKSPLIQKSFNDALVVAPTDASVLITGESGTGKEVIARFIQENSTRAKNSFVKINCASLPETLLESELFGHIKGAFTGADSDKVGLFQAADNGTIFLDEIGDMPLLLQAKLLRVLEESKVRKVGDVKEVEISVRIIAATNRNLETEIENKNFREDLYFRLNVFEIWLPPLRERKEDIAILSKAFLKKANPLAKFSPAILNFFQKYSWHGNIRELKNVVERAGILARGEIILPEHLPIKLQKGFEEQYKFNESKPTNSDNMPISIQDAEKDAILRALQTANGNRTKAAQILGISRRGLLNKIKQFELQPKN